MGLAWSLSHLIWAGDQSVMDFFFVILTRWRHYLWF